MIATDISDMYARPAYVANASARERLGNLGHDSLDDIPIDAITIVTHESFARELQQDTLISGYGHEHSGRAKRLFPVWPDPLAP